jgi:hypothetical protein
MKNFLILFFITASLFKTSDSFGQVNVKDSMALVTFYDSTNGPNWKNNTNWLTANPVSTWYGVTVTNERVTGVILSNNGLVGKIPVHQHFKGGTLSSLQYLELDSNQLSGKIPPELTNLKSLLYLILDNNQLTGTLSSNWAKLTNLQRFNVANNQLTGPIPVSLGSLVDLQYLYVSYNQLSGTVPDTLGNLTNLLSIGIGHNELTGTIPSSFGNLKSIISIYIDSTLLGEEIPSSLNNLPNLQKLVISEDYFTFDGIEQLAQTYATIQNLHYWPQAIIPLNYSGGNFSVSAGGTLANDTFKLYQNGALYATQIGDSVFPVTAVGSYYMTITNDVAKKLTLYTDTVLISSLAVRNLNISAIYSNKNALIKWTTASEINTDYFEVERSTDGINFSPIGKVNAAGNSSTQKSYSYTDAAASSLGKTIVYYRLYEIDKDNAGTYSSVVMIKTIPATVALSIFPNPATSVVNLNFSSASGTASIGIFDMSGHALQQINQTVAPGGIISINTSNFAAGIYFIHVNINGTDMEQKFVKE